MLHEPVLIVVSLSKTHHISIGYSEPANHVQLNLLQTDGATNEA